MRAAQHGGNTPACFQRAADALQVVDRLAVACAHTAFVAHAGHQQKRAAVVGADGETFAREVQRDGASPAVGLQRDVARAERQVVDVCGVVAFALRAEIDCPPAFCGFARGDAVRKCGIGDDRRHFDLACGLVACVVDEAILETQLCTWADVRGKTRADSCCKAR